MWISSNISKKFQDNNSIGILVRLTAQMRSIEDKLIKFALPSAVFAELIPKISDYEFEYKEGEKIEMTTPVYMYPEDDTSAMEFVLPKKYMKQDAPTPSQNNVEIYQSEPGYFAAVRYGGYSNATKVKTHTERLMKEIEKHSLKKISEPVVLSYDSPYKVMNRRNEILVEISYAEAD